MKQKESNFIFWVAVTGMVLFFTRCTDSSTGNTKDQFVNSLIMPAISVTGTQLAQDFSKYDSLEIDVDTSTSPTNPATYRAFGYYTTSAGVKKDNITSHFPAQGAPITLSGGFTISPTKCLGKTSAVQPNANQSNYYLIPVRVSTPGGWYLAFNINTAPNGTPGGSTLKTINPCPPDHPSLQ